MLSGVWIVGDSCAARSCAARSTPPVATWGMALTDGSTEGLETPDDLSDWLGGGMEEVLDFEGSNRCHPTAEVSLCLSMSVFAWLRGANTSQSSSVIFPKRPRPRRRPDTNIGNVMAPLRPTCWTPNLHVILSFVYVLKTSVLLSSATGIPLT